MLANKQIVGICDAQENFYGSVEVVFVDDIAAIPSADVEEVRHGEWIKQCVSQELCGIEYYRCSLCNREEQYKPPYCHCGARMDGKKGD